MIKPSPPPTPTQRCTSKRSSCRAAASPPPPPPSPPSPAASKLRMLKLLKIPIKSELIASLLAYRSATPKKRLGAHALEAVATADCVRRANLASSYAHTAERGFAAASRIRATIASVNTFNTSGGEAAAAAPLFVVALSCEGPVPPPAPRFPPLMPPQLARVFCCCCCCCWARPARPLLGLEGGMV